MTDKKSWGSTVLGWFVVDDGKAAPEQPSFGEGAPPPDITPPAEAASFGDAAVDAAVSSEAAAPASTGAPPVFQGGVPPAPRGNVDFDAVFEAAGIAAGERDLFAKAAGLLSNLPQGADPATRKAIVEASLTAFGIPIDRIIETGAHSIQTLEAYLQEQAAKTRSVAEESQKLIADYESKIRDVRALLERRIAEQGAVEASCNDRKLEIQGVLEFFGQEAVAKVVRESPKLVEPTTTRDRRE